MQSLMRLANQSTQGGAERDADASYMFPKAVSPVPMPQPAPMPSGTPMRLPPAYGAPAAPTGDAAGAAELERTMADLNNPASPNSPLNHNSTFSNVQAGSSSTAPGMYGGAPNGIGENGFGLHPNVSHDQLTNYLMSALRNHESTNDYKKLVQGYEPGKRTASGAYQVTDGRWNHYQGFPRAVDAPPHIQDQWAKENISNALKRYGYDPFKAVASHYYPAWAHDPSKWNDTPISNGAPIKNAQTISQYLGKVLPPERVSQYLAGIGNAGGQGGSNGAAL